MTKGILKLKSLAVLMLLATIGFHSTKASAQLSPGDSFGIGSGDSNGGFYDGAINYDQAVEITHLLYQAILFRDAEPEGLDFWVSNILSQPGTDGLLNTAQAIAESQEFRDNVYYRRNAPQILANIYQVLFHRRVDVSGKATWTEMIRNGRAGQALRGIVGSDEFRDLYLRH